jgi:hypothetical protein
VEAGNNITYCPDENKMINTTINSVVTLMSEFTTTCKTRLNSDAIDRSLQRAWEYANRPNDDPTVFVNEANALSDGTTKFAPTTERARSRASRTRTSKIF